MGQRWTLHGHYIYYYCMNGKDHNGKVMTWTETGGNATVTPGKAVVEDPVSKKRKILQPRVMNLKNGCSEGKDQVCEHL